MPQANLAQTSWRFGEVSPLLRGRADLDAYKQGCEKLENFIVTPQGSLLRRPGTENISYITSTGLRIIEFRAADNDSYILKLFQGTYDAYRWGSLVLKNGQLMYGLNGQRIENITANGSGDALIRITNHQLSAADFIYIQGCNGGVANGRYTGDVVDANHIKIIGTPPTTYSGGGVLYFDKLGDSGAIGRVIRITNVVLAAGVMTFTTSTAHGFSAGQRIGVTAVLGATEANGQWTVATGSGSSFTVTYSGTMTAYTSGGCVSNSALLIPMNPLHTYTNAQLKQLSKCQSADVMFFAHPDLAPYTLSRLSDHQWEWRKVEFVDGPYLARNPTYTRLTISGFTDTATFVDTQLRPSYNITTIANNGAGLFRITTVGHGLITGDRVRISGITNYTAANGYWVVTRIDADNFDLVGSTFAGAGASNGAWKEVVYFVSGDVDEYLQYREDNQWKLAKVTAYTDETTVTADIKSNLLLNIDESIALKSSVNRSTNNAFFTKGGYWQARGTNQLYRTRVEALQSVNGINPAADLVAGGTLASTYSGTFTRNDVGKFIKDQAGTWRQISSFATDKSVNYTTPTRIVGDNDETEADLIYHSRAITATITAAGPTTADSNIFASTDVGRPIRLNFSGVSIWCRITAYTSATQVSVEFFQEVPLDPKDNTTIRNGGVLTDWQLGAWSDATGYPNSVCIHEQRLTFGGNTEQPQTVWMSVSGDYWNFAPTEPDGTVQDDNAITYTIASEDVSPVVWMISAKVLLIGTQGSEWQAKAASSFMEPLTPSNISVTPQSSYGSAPNHQAQRVGNSIYFLQRDGTRLRKMSYDFNSDGWVSSDVSLASEHMMRNGRSGVQLAYQISPFSILWVLLDDGTLASATINEDENQFSWAHHTLGQYNSLCVTDSILVINKDDSTYSRLYIAGVRNNSARYQVERLGLFWLPSGDTAKTALTTAYLDDYTSRTLAAATTSTPSTNVPDGASVGVWINGAYIGAKTVSSGSISLGATYSGTAYIGYVFTSTLKQLPPEGGSGFGVSMVKTKRVHRVGTRVFSSYKLNHGPSESSLTEHVFPSTTTNFFTGDDKFSIKNPYDFESGIVLSISEPWPLNILAVAPELQTHE